MPKWNENWCTLRDVSYEIIDELKCRTERFSLPKQIAFGPSLYREHLSSIAREIFKLISIICGGEVALIVRAIR